MLEKVNKYLTDISFVNPESYESGFLADLKDSI
jgi:hypothetical protein